MVYMPLNLWGQEWMALPTIPARQTERLNFHIPLWQDTGSGLYTCLITL